MQYYRDEPALNNNGAIVDLPANNNHSASFKFETKIASRIGNHDRRNIKIMLPLKYLKSGSHLPKKYVLFAWFKVLRNRFDKWPKSW